MRDAPRTTIRIDIEDRLKKYIPEPVVTVTVDETAGNRIFVIGQVNKAGRVRDEPAAQRAAGAEPWPAERRRSRSSTTSSSFADGSGADQSLPFRYSQVTEGKALGQNILLEAGDVVVVP